MRTHPGPMDVSIWQRQFSLSGLIALVARRKIPIILAAGIGFRVAMYLSDRPFWQDESSLAINVDRLSPREFFGQLGFQQLAPPYFLTAVWVCGALFGHNRLAMRLIPLLGGIASLFLFLGVARRCLRPRAVFPALVMFACTEDLIFFSSEMKQYSSDLASSLACLLLGLTVGWTRLNPVRTAFLAAWGMAIVWFSHTAIFALAAVGIVGLGRAVVARDRRLADPWLLVGTSWVAGFAAVHAVAVQQLGKDTQMWVFWSFAFPPMPPATAWDASWIFRRLAYYFVNPLGFDSPFGQRLSLIPALGLALLGGVGLWKDDRSKFALLMLPVAFVLAASGLKAYPFHGRLVLFLAPSPLIATAAGLEWVRERRGRGILYAALATMVLVVPASGAVFHLFSRIDDTRNFVGDRRDHRLNPINFPL